MNRDKPSPPWWGKFDLQEGIGKRWQIGPLTLWVRRLAREWWIASRRSEKNGQIMEIAADELGEEWLSHNSFERYISSRAQPSLYLSPILADRPVVTRPVVPFHLCGGEQVTVYVHTPVWVRLEAGPDRQLLKEIATVRLSDTWFGSSTQQGELCYASRTHCRLDVREVPIRSYSAVTPVLIHNKVRGTLVLERLSLPVHYLSVYGTVEGGLWTQPVSMKWDEDNTVSLDIVARPPAEVGDARLLCGPHREAEKGGLVRAVAAFFG
jgi:hypothetical protein